MIELTGGQGAPNPDFGRAEGGMIICRTTAEKLNLATFLMDRRHAEGL
jgi:hypothetical protein